VPIEPDRAEPLAEAVTWTAANGRNDEIAAASDGAVDHVRPFSVRSVDRYLGDCNGVKFKLVSEHVLAKEFAVRALLT
jgi:hypothetical protein